jgi:hypothetical protein
MGPGGLLIFGSFILGAVLFYLFRFFPATSLLLGLSAAAYCTTKKKYLLVPVMLFGVAYAFFRYSPPVESLDIWNRELRLIGSFVPKADAPADLHDQEVSIFSDVEADTQEEYEAVSPETALISAGRQNPFGQVKTAF